MKSPLILSSLLLGLIACLAEEPAAQGAPAAKVIRQKVVVVQDRESIQAFTPQPDRVRAMVAAGVKQVTGKSDVAAAWKSLVTPKDTVGIKVYSSPGPASGTRSDVVAGVVEGLIAAGIPKGRIIIWDRRMEDLSAAGFDKLAAQLGVKLASSLESGYDEKVAYDSPLLGNLVYGDLEFGKKGDGIGRKSYFSKLIVRQMTKIISITPLLNHNQVGVSGHLYGLVQGSVDNFIRFESSGDRLSAAVPEIFALPELSERLVLAITDALICQYQGEERALLHYSSMLHQLRFSKDPVALDALSVQELEDQRKIVNLPSTKPNISLYENAFLLELGQYEPKSIPVETIQSGEASRTR